MKHILLIVAITPALASLAACGDGPMSASGAEQALVDVGRPSSGDFEHGSFDFSKQIKGVGSEDEGRLAAMSWDIYYVLDDGDVGAWGAGMDVFDSDANAQSSAERMATFWVCDGARENLDLHQDGYDVLEASTCKRPTEDGYYATLSAADGVVTANLTIASHDRDVAAQALVAAWQQFSASTRRVVEDVS